MYTYRYIYIYKYICVYACTWLLLQHKLFGPKNFKFLIVCAQFKTRRVGEWAPAGGRWVADSNQPAGTCRLAKDFKFW